MVRVGLRGTHPVGGQRRVTGHALFGGMRREFGMEHTVAEGLGVQRLAPLGGHLEVMLDTGITSGADVVAAVALGARFTLVGRAYLYGLMAGGRAGVDRAITILRDEVVRTMKLLGVHSVAELGPQHVTQLRRLAPIDERPARGGDPG